MLTGDGGGRDNPAAAASPRTTAPNPPPASISYSQQFAAAGLPAHQQSSAPHTAGVWELTTTACRAKTKPGRESRAAMPRLPPVPTPSALGKTKAKVGMNF